MDELIPHGRIGIVGAGAFGRFCIDAFCDAPDLTVVAVADPDPSALASIVLPGCRLTTDWEDVVAADDIEVVHVITPPFLRRPIVDAAISMGKSVFCEKPPALSLAELDEMVSAAIRQGVAFSVDYVMRHLAIYRFLETASRSGVFGSPRTLSFVNLAQIVPHGHWFWDRSRSGGIFVEHGIHFFDIYGRVFGPPCAISAQTLRAGAEIATITYTQGGVGAYLHEFAYPREAERTQALLGFDRATVAIDGWIPTKLEGTAPGEAVALRDIASAMRLTFSLPPDREDQFTIYVPDRQQQYRTAIAAGMRDTLRQHRDPRHDMSVPIEEIRASLDIALLAQDAAGRPGSHNRESGREVAGM